MNEAPERKGMMPVSSPQPEHVMRHAGRAGGGRSVTAAEKAQAHEVSLRRILEAEGYFVFSAADGKQGLELIKRIKPPCLILLDVIMPLMNGEEFMAELIRDPVLHLVPVVVVSAFPQEAKKLLASAFVQKPIDLDTLLDAVSQHCTCLRPNPPTP